MYLYMEVLTLKSSSKLEPEGMYGRYVDLAARSLMLLIGMTSLVTVRKAVRLAVYMAMIQIQNIYQNMANILEDNPTTRTSTPEYTTETMRSKEYSSS